MIATRIYEHKQKVTCPRLVDKIVTVRIEIFISYGDFSLHCGFSL